uniref:Uncharacterized protein n=1 Tax=uncultured bacterium F42-01 TaxID=1191438 RepID=I3VIK7_9BACT|nr:hypothetical protein [uncultured bacterium F42-01]
MPRPNLPVGIPIAGGGLGWEDFGCFSWPAQSGGTHDARMLPSADTNFAISGDVTVKKAGKFDDNRLHVMKKSAD